MTHPNVIVKHLLLATVFGFSVALCAQQESPQPANPPKPQPQAKAAPKPAEPTAKPKSDSEKIILPVTPIQGNAKSDTKTDTASVLRPTVKTEKPKAEKPKVERKAEGQGDPFHYEDRDASDYVPMDNTPLTLQIVIRGICINGDGEAMALIELPEQNRTFFKKRNDVIRLPPVMQGNKIVSEERYLQITDIRAQEVEIVQQKRNDAPIIVQ